MKCGSCGAEIDKITKFCPECGHLLDVITKPKESKPWYVYLIIISTGLVIVCLLTMALPFLFPIESDSKIIASAIPTIEPAPSKEQPIKAVATYAATNLMPTPSVLTVRDIEQQKNDLTDMQWSEYKRGLTGQKIEFSGKVREVYEDGSISINDGSGIFTICELNGIPHERALTVTKDNYISGTGVVKEIDEFIMFTVVIFINDYEIY